MKEQKGVLYAEVKSTKKWIALIIKREAIEGGQEVGLDQGQEVTGGTGVVGIKEVVAEAEREVENRGQNRGTGIERKVENRDQAVVAVVLQNRGQDLVRNP